MPSACALGRVLASVVVDVPTGFLVAAVVPDHRVGLDRPGCGAVAGRVLGCRGIAVATSALTAVMRAGRRPSSRPVTRIGPRPVGGLISVAWPQPERLRRKLGRLLPALIWLGIVPDLPGRLGIMPDLAWQIGPHGLDLDRIWIHRPRQERLALQRAIRPRFGARSARSGTRRSAGGLARAALR
jgi:hypothetical protein